MSLFIDPTQVNYIQDLEARIGKKLPQLEYEDIFSKNVIGYSMEDEEVVALALDNLHIGSFPKEIFQFPSLRRLRIRKNDIRKLPENIGDLKNLELLDLSHNPITSLPDSIGNLQKLQILDLWRAKLQSINHNITKLDKISILALSYNSLEFLPKFFFEWAEQLGLHLTLKEPPAKIYNVGSKEIYISQNDFHRMLPTNVLASTEEEIITWLHDNEAFLIDQTRASVKAKLHSDRWADSDLLGYELYAQTITNMLTSDDTQPPLTVGIIAPWGQGKTTLMRFIEREIRSKYGSKKQEKSQKSSIAFSKARKWMRTEVFTLKNPLRYPTIWFNPWQYQSSDQIWAGMADAIIRQMVEYLDPIEQAEFWFKLQLKRIDRQAIRQGIYQTVLARLIPNLVVLTLAVIAFFGFFITKALDGLGLTLSTLIGAITVGNGIWAGRKNYKRGLEEKVKQFVQVPDYSKELGTFHLVSSDLERVFSLLGEEPAIVFIDDLDRCSPQQVVEVVEAINLMMSAGFRDKCYFIIGMDAEIVAAALDSAYKGMHGKIDYRTRRAGSVGWYFLDKLVQLPFFIPVIKHDAQEDYLIRLFESNEVVSEKTSSQHKSIPKSKDEIKTVARKLHETQDEKEIHKILNENQQQMQQVAREFNELTFQSNRDSTALRAQVKAFSSYLDPSPRSIKRFANLLRFYYTHQLRRKKFEQEYAEIEALAKWLTITLRWPLLVRWIQWSHEDELIWKLPHAEENEEINSEKLDSESPLKKAKFLDIKIRNLVEDNPHQGFETLFSNWEKQFKENNHLPWITDKGLLKLLLENHSEESSFQRALACGVW